MLVLWAPSKRRRWVASGLGRGFRAQPLYIQQRNLPIKALAMRIANPGDTPSTVSFDSEETVKGGVTLLDVPEVVKPTASTVFSSSTS
jgi:hypothetical protein